MNKKQKVITINTRNYNPPEYECWKESEVIAHSQDINALIEKYPDAVILNADVANVGLLTFE